MRYFTTFHSILQNMDIFMESFYKFTPNLRYGHGLPMGFSLSKAYDAVMAMSIS